MTLVEGASLATLSDIAASPPDRPNPESRKYRGLLILYIVRVPGSQDIFLTPQKPREKTVTAEDVNSCLYYLHSNNMDDQKLLKEKGWRLSQSEGSLDAAELYVAENRFLDDSTNRDFSGSSRPPFTPRGSYGGENQPPGRKNHNIPSQQQFRNASTGQTSPILPSIPPERPPPYMEAQEWNRLQPKQNSGPKLPPRRKPVPNSATSPLPPVVPHDRYLEATQNPNSGPPLQLPVDSNTQSRQQEWNLTLVRRIPYSEQQWNVAEIIDLATGGGNQGQPLHTLSGRTAVLNILNPAYSKFERGAEGANPQGWSVPFSRKLISDNPHLNSFNRLSVGPARSRGGSLGEKQTSSNQHSSSMTSQGGPDEARYKRLTYSGMSIPKRTRRACFSFNSPWGGRCEISDSLSGDSLKCRYLPGSGSSTQISELRFDLPPSSKSRTPEVNSSEMSELRALGKERAGGGFGGKRAKLGKLIIEEEGIDMMDLIVTANMALWWRVCRNSQNSRNVS